MLNEEMSRKTYEMNKKKKEITKPSIKKIQSKKPSFMLDFFDLYT